MLREYIGNNYINQIRSEKLMITEKKKVVHTCSLCNKNTHIWHEVYYEDRAKLLRAENLYITWCKEAKGFVIANN